MSFIILIKEKSLLFYLSLISHNKVYTTKYSFRNNKATIHAIDINNWNQEIRIMEKAHNLSYPLIFKYKGEFYLLPNEKDINEIALYKSTGFPSEWEKVTTLISNFNASDSTLFEHDKLWWLTCTSNNDSRHMKLYVYYSDNLFGPWLPHKKNPVKTDIRSSRPAGNILKYNDFLLRPSQDCSKTYGGRIVINKILKLTPEEFEEEPFKFLEINYERDFNKGIHTLNSIDKITIIDGKRYVFSLSQINKLFRKKGIFKF